MRLAGTVVLITGGGGPGIGRTTAELFAREGAAVVAADLLPERAAETAARIVAAGGRALGVEVDVSRKSDVDEMVRRAEEEFGRVDVLINSAAHSAGDDVLTIDEETWDLNFNVSLKSAYLCSKAVLPGMIARSQGVILNIASVNGLLAVGEEPYSAAKAGMINLTANMALKYGRQGIRVNCIAPGTIRSPGWQPLLDQDPEFFDRLTEWYPLGRIGEPADIAAAALFLVSKEASWITGVTLPIDGGLTAGPYQFGVALQRGRREVR